MNQWIKKARGVLSRSWQVGQYAVVPVLLAAVLTAAGYHVLTDPDFILVQNRVCKVLDHEMSSYEVTLNNEVIAVVETKEEAALAWSEAVRSINTAEITYQISSDYTLTQTTAKPSEFTSAEELTGPFADYIESQVASYTIASYALRIGDDSFVLPSKEAILELFRQLGQNCLGELATVQCTGVENGRPVFDISDVQTLAAEETEEKKELVGLHLAEDVQYQLIYAPADEIMTVEEVYARCVENEIVEKYYQVQSGDSFNRIAAKYDLTLDELLAMNPDYSESSMIYAGDELRVQQPQANVVVYRVMREIYEDYEAPPVEYKYNSSQYVTYSKVLEEGSPAELLVEDLVYYQGENEVERIEVSYEVLKAATTQVLEVGTKALPRFIWPMNGTVTSEYKWRWGRQHWGIDIANSMGTKIVASASGRVIRASWYSTFGKCIMIDHGGGFVTLYAHCSELLVREGDYVKQGEVIARMGDTGNVTGPHLHFEIRVNGDRINPRKYLP